MPHKPKVTQVPCQDEPHALFSLDLIPIDQAKKLVVRNILRIAQIHPEENIYLLDPMERMSGPYLRAKDIREHPNPKLFVLSVIENTSCNWRFWQLWGES